MTWQEIHDTIEIMNDDEKTQQAKVYPPVQCPGMEAVVITAMPFQKEGGDAVLLTGKPLRKPV